MRHCFFFFFWTIAGAYDTLHHILQHGVDTQVYPGAVAMVGNEEGVLYSASVGHYEYSESSPSMTNSTLFDIASLTKVFATTSAVALLYQNNFLSLDTKVTSILGSAFAVNNKQDITIRHCLLHNAGFQPDPVPWYWDEEFGCPNTDTSMPAEDFSCLERIYDSLLNETTTNVNEAYVYSDLSFVTLSFVVGKIVLENNLVTELRPECVSDEFNSYPKLLLCHFEAYVSQEVFNKNDLLNTQYLLPEDMYSEAAPTLNDTGEDSYTHKRLQGQVADGDCYAMGGIAGHAGVFSTVIDMGMFAKTMLRRALHVEKEDDFLSYETVKLFTTVANISQSSRALGWTTNTNTVPDYGYDHSCGTMSNITFMHTGYTGTCMCADPKNKLWSVILTTRIYNCQGQLCPSGSSDAVKEVYRKFNSEAVNMFVRA